MTACWSCLNPALGPSEFNLITLFSFALICPFYCATMVGC
jgi:hypothetical protein